MKPLFLSPPWCVRHARRIRVVRPYTSSRSDRGGQTGNNWSFIASYPFGRRARAPTVCVLTHARRIRRAQLTLSDPPGRVAVGSTIAAAPGPQCNGQSQNQRLDHTVVWA